MGLLRRGRAGVRQVYPEGVSGSRTGEVVNRGAAYEGALGTSGTLRTAGGGHNRPMTSSSLPSLDGRVFRMVSSTTSRVDPASPTVFRYSERAGAIWGEYDGDTVAFGRFVGVRAPRAIRVSFVHVLRKDGTVVEGEGNSDIREQDGLLRLVEHYEMHGSAQLSVCEEVQEE